ncbi:MAG: pyroglutamyl-peptidase I family protein [Xanthobacteraceae bacterium]
MARILVTGFGPFPGAPFNPTEQLISRLARVRRPALDHLATHVFETSYAAVDRDLPELLKRHKPQVLIMFGLAARTKFVRIEILAHNRKSALHPDRKGAVARTLAIAAGTPTVRRGHAPFVRLIAAARSTGIDARLSRDAGRYICNYVYWRALEAAARSGGPQIIVFVHVPKLRSRSGIRGKARLPTLAQLVRAATAIIIAANSANFAH